MSRDERRMTFVVVPHGEEGLGTRSFEISYRRLRVVAVLLALAAVILVVIAASWLLIAARAAQVSGLEEQIAQLEAEREQVAELAESLGRLERQYEQVRTLVGADEGPERGSIWLPPAGGRVRSEAGPADSLRASLPSAWPLTQQGFVTREHLGRVPGQHPGIDIAVAEGAYVRTAGSGVVVEAGEDEIYGKYVRIRHRDGYETMYAHTSQLFVASGDRVERHEVIALSGNTGTSTAPHLHFEILKDGEPIDPRTMVQAP